MSVHGKECVCVRVCVCAFELDFLCCCIGISLCVLLFLLDCYILIHELDHNNDNLRLACALLTFLSVHLVSPT